MPQFAENGTADIAELTALYDSVGWTTYTANPSVMAGLLTGAAWWCTAREAGELVGLIRVISDGISIAYVQDLLVHPAHQRAGIGSELMRRARATYPHVRQFVLVTDASADTESFYRGCGLVPIVEESGMCFVAYGT